MMVSAILLLVLGQTDVLPVPPEGWSPPKIEVVQPAKREPVTAYGKARKKSVENNVPLVVMIGAEWCGPCRTLKKSLRGWEDRKDLAYVHLDVDKDGALARQIINGSSIPQVHIWKDPNVGVKSSQIGANLQWIIGELRKINNQPPRGVIRTSSWTWPGTPSVLALEAHLCVEPHEDDPEILATLTDDQIVGVHEVWHNENGPR